MTIFKIKPQIDLPTSDAKLLGHKEIVKNLHKFLTSNDMIGPLSIAIHGDWGQGKTGILRTLEEKLKSENDAEPIFFEAWKHEYSNPGLALVATIIQTFETRRDQSRILVNVAANILSHKFLNMELGQVTDSIRKSSKDAESLHTKLGDLIRTKLKDKKLFILIDDLDRCDVENTLMLLAVMKLFLDAENCVCIAAVDFKRLEYAWKKKYGIEDQDTKEGRSYLEKIFQIRIGIPAPTDDQLKEYVRSLVDKIPNDILDLIVTVGHRNPRNIKRMFNLISYRKSIFNDEELGQIVAVVWTTLEIVCSQKGAIEYSEAISKMLNFVDLIVTHGNRWENVKERFNIRQGSYVKYNPNILQDMMNFFSLSKIVLNNTSKNARELTPFFEKLHDISNEIFD